MLLRRKRILILAVGATVVILIILLLLRGKKELLPIQAVLSGGRHSYIDHSGNLYYTSGTTFSKKTPDGKLQSLSGQYDLPDITETAWGSEGVAFAATNYNGNKLLFDEYIAKQGGGEQDTVWWYLSFGDSSITQLVVPPGQPGTIQSSGNTPAREQETDEESPPEKINAAVRDDKQENVLASATTETGTYIFDLSSEVNVTLETGDCKLLQVRLPRFLVGCGGVANNETYILYNYESKTEEKRLKDKSFGRPYIVEGGTVLKEFKPEKIIPNEQDSHDHSRPAASDVILLKDNNSEEVLKKSFDGVFYTNLVGNDDYVLFSDGVEKVTEPFRLDIMRLKDRKSSKLSFYQETSENIDDIRLTRISDDKKSYSFLLTNKGENSVYELTYGNLKPQYDANKAPDLFAQQGSEIKQENYTIVYDSTLKTIKVYYPLPGPNGPIDKQAQEFLQQRGVDLTQYDFRVQPETLRLP